MKKKRGWFTRTFERITGIREDDARLIKGTNGYYSTGINSHNAAMCGGVDVEEVITHVAWTTASGYRKTLRVTDEGGRALDFHLDPPRDVVLSNGDRICLSVLTRITFPALPDRVLTDIILSNESLSGLYFIYATLDWDVAEF